MTPNNSTTEKPKKPLYKRPWFIVLIVVLLLIGLIAGLTEDETEDTNAAETTTAEETTVQEQETTEAPATEEEPAQDQDGDVGEVFEQWWLSRYEASSWQDIADQFPGGWEGNVLSVGSSANGDTLIFVTNLDGNNPDGEARAEAIITSVQNVAGIDADIPDQVKDNVQFIQVFSANSDLIANGGVEFTA